jgi:hypothetical protein
MDASWELSLHEKLATTERLTHIKVVADTTTAGDILTQVARISDYSATRQFPLIGTLRETPC